MNNAIQINVNENEFKETHEEKLNVVLARVNEIVPEGSKLEGHIQGEYGNYEGRIHIRSRIGAIVAKAKARNLFSLIAKLNTKVLRQLVNWREKRAAKGRYLRRRRNSPNLLDEI